MQPSKPTTEQHPHSVDQLLQKGSDLTLLKAKAAQLSRANAILKQVLAPPLQQHCFVVNIDQQTLILATENATFATQLRYQQRTILNAFQQHSQFHLLQHVKTKIYLAPHHEKKTPPRKISMSYRVSQLVEKTANNISHNSLKKALLKLAKNYHQE